MTISEEKKERIIELFEKGLNKKEISRSTQVSYPTIKNILNKNNTEQNQKEITERDEFVKKKLLNGCYMVVANVIFLSENFVFNLKKYFTAGFFCCGSLFSSPLLKILIFYYLILEMEFL